MKPRSLTLRALRKDDAALLRAVAPSFARWSRAPKRTLAALTTAPGSETLVAEAGEEALGLVTLSFEELRARSFGPFESPRVARIDAIAVAPAARRQGIARELLATAEARARERGAVVITLMTAVSNAPARRLFTGAGYLPVLRQPRAYANGEDAIEMFRLIATG